MLIHQTHVLLHQSGRQRPRRWAICGRRLWGHRPAVPSTRRQYDDGPRRRSGLWPWGRRRGCGMRRRPPLLQKALRRRLTSADCRGSSSRSRSSRSSRGSRSSRSSSRRGAAAGVDETTSQARAPNLLHDRLPPPPRALFGALLEQLGIPREPHLFTDGLLAVRPAVVDLAPLARRQLVEAPARQLPSEGRRGPRSEEIPVGKGGRRGEHMHAVALRGPKRTVMVTRHTRGCPQRRRRRARRSMRCSTRHEGVAMIEHPRLGAAAHRRVVWPRRQRQGPTAPTMQSLAPRWQRRPSCISRCISRARPTRRGGSPRS